MFQSFTGSVTSALSTEQTPILQGASPTGYDRLDGDAFNSNNYYRRPEMPYDDDESVPDTGQWFSYRFDTSAPFWTILHQRNFSLTSRTSWIDLLYLIYMKSKTTIAHPLFQRLVGIACAVASSFFLSVGFAISKAVNENIDSLALYAWRQTFLVLFTMPMTKYNDKPIYFGHSDLKAWLQLLARTLFGSLNIYCIFKAITYISLTDATVVSTTAPIFCSVLAYFILGERFGATEVLCAVAVAVGVMFSSQPRWLFDPSMLAQGDVVQRIIGLLIALCGAMSGAMSTVLMRTMRHIHFSTVQIVYSYLSAVFTWPLVLALGVDALPPCTYSKKFAVTVIGFTALPMQAFYIIACQREKAGVVSIARACTPVFSFIWQVLIFGHGINGFSLFGDLIIMAAIISLAAKKLFAARDDAKDIDMKTTTKGDDSGGGVNTSAATQPASRYEPIAVSNDYAAGYGYGESNPHLNYSATDFSTPATSYQW